MFNTAKSKKTSASEKLSGLDKSLLKIGIKIGLAPTVKKI
jgi:hypothetical protein